MTALAVVVVVAAQARGTPTPHTHPLVMVVVADTVLYARVHLHATPSFCTQQAVCVVYQIKHQTSRLVSKQQNLTNIHVVVVDFSLCSGCSPKKLGHLAIVHLLCVSLSLATILLVCVAVITAAIDIQSSFTAPTIFDTLGLAFCVHSDCLRTVSSQCLVQALLSLLPLLCSATLHTHTHTAAAAAAIPSLLYMHMRDSG